ncbi:uncharacterized protein [Dermacentor albipictus]|uniref:uncharacterized protein n=1 Tax=Dermacentor albipictus TaxID=60249 RepID=UPI0038FD3DA7
MTHVLVKWLTEESWDVYSVRAIVDAQLGFRLLTEEGFIDQVRGSTVSIKWTDNSAPAEAQLLDFGVHKALEKKRTQLVKAVLQRRGEQPLGQVASKRKCEGCDCEASRKVVVLEAQVQELKKKLEAANNNLESFAMLMKANKLVRRLEGLADVQKATQVVQAEQVDIGNGILVEKTVLSRLRAHCGGLPTKFARNLLRHVFGDEGLRGKSLYGKGSNTNKEGPVKEGLCPLKLNAVIGYTCTQFDTTTLQIKSSLSSMISREIK